MTWPEALEIVIGRTKHERFRILTANDHPDHEIWRARMLEMAGQDSPPVVHYPPAATQVRNLFRSALGWARSGFKIAPKAERTHRLAICLACPKYDSAQKRCTVCGCFNKARVFIASDSCPLDPPKWEAIT